MAVNIKLRQFIVEKKLMRSQLFLNPCIELTICSLLINVFSSEVALFGQCDHFYSPILCPNKSFILFSEVCYPFKIFGSCCQCPCHRFLYELFSLVTAGENGLDAALPDKQWLEMQF